MQELKIFENADFGQVRTLTEGDKTLFCGSDVAKALGYDQPHKAIARHCKGDGGTTHTVIDSIGRQQQAKFITEGNLYRLIVNSKLPSAEKFEKWVFDEVLPSIRKTGTYSRPLTQAELIAAQAQVLVDMERKIDDTSKKLDKALDVFATPPQDTWRDSTNHIINSICQSQGFNYQVYKGDLYKELERTARCDISARQRNLKARLKQAGALSAEYRAISKIDVIERDSKLRLIFDGIVKRQQAKYLS